MASSINSDFLYNARFVCSNVGKCWVTFRPVFHKIIDVEMFARFEAPV